MENETNVLPRLNSLDDLIEIFKMLKEEPTLHGIGFDMDSEFEHREKTSKECGSACCIGGWVQACNPETRNLSISKALQTIAPYAHSSEVYDVCWPDNTKAYKNATPEDAIRVLEALRDTGKSIWNEIEFEEKEEETV